MGDTMDKAKGTVEEKAGEATDDRDLQAHGKLDRFSGDVKSKTEDLTDKAHDEGEKLIDKTDDAL